MRTFLVARPDRTTSVSPLHEVSPGAEEVADDEEEEKDVNGGKFEFVDDACISPGAIVSPFALVDGDVNEEEWLPSRRGCVLAAESFGGSNAVAGCGVEPAAPPAVDARSLEDTPVSSRVSENLPAGKEEYCCDGGKAMRAPREVLDCGTLGRGSHHQFLRLFLPPPLPHDLPPDLPPFACPC